MVMLFFHHASEGEADSALRQMMSKGLLNDAEKDFLQNLKSHNQRSLTLTYWTAEAMNKGLITMKNEKAMKLLLAPLLKIGNDQCDVMDTLAMPLPFPYFHLLSIMVIMNEIL